MKKYDIIIIGAGPGGIFSAYELINKSAELKIAVIEAGHELAKRRCPIDGNKIKTCIKCKNCSIMSGFRRSHPSPVGYCGNPLRRRYGCGRENRN